MAIRISATLGCLAICVLSGLLHATAVAAQQIPAGSLVRVHQAEPPPLTGLVERLSSDTLWLRVDRAPWPIGVGTIHRLELRQRETRGRSGWKWAKRGLLAGALIGGVTCLADRDECVSGLGPDDGLTEGFLAASMMAGGGVGLIGFAVGAAMPGHRWVEIPLPRSGPP